MTMQYVHMTWIVPNPFNSSDCVTHSPKPWRALAAFQCIRHFWNMKAGFSRLTKQSYMSSIYAPDDLWRSIKLVVMQDDLCFVASNITEAEVTFSARVIGSALMFVCANHTWKTFPPMQARECMCWNGFWDHTSQVAYAFLLCTWSWFARYNLVTGPFAEPTASSQTRDNLSPLTGSQNPLIGCRHVHYFYRWIGLDPFNMCHYKMQHGGLGVQEKAKKNEHVCPHFADSKFFALDRRWPWRSRRLILDMIRLLQLCVRICARFPIPASHMTIWQ